jgi:ATP-dependent protease Clp ATPase subunit
MVPEDRKQGEVFRDVEPEDLLKYGLIPEFVGPLSGGSDATLRHPKLPQCERIIRL